MRNKMMIGLVAMLSVLFVSCSGGGVGGDTAEQLSASFQEGVSPEDISGTYDMTKSDVTSNPCQIPQKTQTPAAPIGGAKVEFVQDGEKLGIADPNGDDVIWDGSTEGEIGISTTYSGKVSGNSFKIEIGTTISGDETNPDCKVETKGVWVGTVTGDNFDSTLVASMAATPDCPEKAKKYAGCSVAGTLIGVRSKDVETSKAQVTSESAGKGIIDTELFKKNFPIPIE